MKRLLLNPKQLFDPRFFTHTVAVTGPMRLVYVSGQVSYDRDGIVVGAGDIRAQSEQVFKSLTHNLAAAGAAWSDVIKMNAYMVDLNPDALNIYREVRARFIDAKAMPASTLVGVDRLVHEDLLLEVEVIAAVPEQAAPRAPRARATSPAPRARATSPAPRARATSPAPKARAMSSAPNARATSPAPKARTAPRAAKPSSAARPAKRRR